VSPETLAAQGLGEVDPVSGVTWGLDVEFTDTSDLAAVQASIRPGRTLFLRVDRACDSALAIATHFHGHPAVAAVLYPGLPSHPGHEIAARQMHGGFGGMLSIRLAGGSSHALAVLPAVRVFKRATSLGGVESLIEHRRSMEGPSSPVPGDLLRLSIGIEAPADLIADLESALAAAQDHHNARGTPVTS
jgi:cystathionine gamma-synthase